MTLSNGLTRDQVRAAFENNLTYADIKPVDVRALEGFIAVECARHDLDHGRKGEILMLMHPSYCNEYEPRIVPAQNGKGICEAYLRVDGSYFQGREAISFNKDGFIGIAGWADRNNVQPFLRAFLLWLSEWFGFDNVSVRGTASTLQSAAALAC